MEKDGEPMTELKRKKYRAVLSAIWKDKFIRYYNLIFFSFAKQSDSFSFGILGYVLAKNPEGEFVVRTSTDGVIRQNKEAKTLIETLLERDDESSLQMD